MGLFDNLKKKNEAKQLGLSIEQYESFLVAQSAGLTLDDFKQYLSSFSAKYSIPQFVDYLKLKKTGLSEQQCEKYFDQYASSISLEDYPGFIEAEKLGLSPSEFATYSATLKSKMSVADYVEFLRAQKLGFTLGKYLKYLKSFKGEMTLEEYDLYLQAESNGVDHEHYLEYLNHFKGKYTLERYLEFDKARSLGMTLEEYDLRSEATKAGMSLEDYKKHIKAKELDLSDAEYSCFLEVSESNWIVDGVLTIPKTLKDLPANVFKHFSFHAIAFPKTLQSISDYAFEGCIGLETLVVPSTVTTIGDGAFLGCSGLQSVSLNPGLVKIGDSAFENCTALKSVFIPGTVKDVGYHSFNGCTSLEELEFETGVESIDISDWTDLPCLKTVITPCTASFMCRPPYKKGDPRYGIINAIDKLSFNKEAKVDIISPADYFSYGIGENRSEIEYLEVNGDYVFLNLSGFYKLKTVVFSAQGSIAHIENCPELQMIVYRSYLAEIPVSKIIPGIKNTEQMIHAKSLTAKEILAPKLRFLVVEDGALVIDLDHYEGSQFTWLHVPSCTSRLGINSPSITSVAIHGNCKVKDESLSEASSIHKLRFDVDGRDDGVFSNTRTQRIISSEINSCDQIDIQFDCPVFTADLFGHQGAVRHISLPKGVERIESNAFDSWGIEEIVIPSTVKSIGDEAFRNCNKLSVVTFEGVPSEIGCDLFSGCTSIDSIHIAGKELPVSEFAGKYETKNKTWNTVAEVGRDSKTTEPVPVTPDHIETVSQTDESPLEMQEPFSSTVGSISVMVGNYFSIELPENYKYSVDRSVIGSNRALVAILDDEKSDINSPYSATESVTILLGNDVTSIAEADSLSKSIGIENGTVIVDGHGLNIRYSVKELSRDLSILLALICTGKKAFPAQFFFNSSLRANPEQFVNTILSSINAVEEEETQGKEAMPSFEAAASTKATVSKKDEYVAPAPTKKESVHVVDGVKYLPGEEPIKIRQRIETLFEKLDRAYPDKVIVALHKDHKNWGETVTDLYRQLGYPDGNSFLKAYGYSVGVEKAGRPAGDATAVIDELRKRYSAGPTCSRIADLISENPDLASKFKNLQNQADKFFGMPFAKYLIQEGILIGAADDNCGEVFQALKQRYASRPFVGTVNELRAANEDIDWKAINRFYAQSKTTDTLKSFLVNHGIMSEKKASAEESLEAIMQTLKKRYPEGSELPHSIEQLKIENADLSLFGLNSLTMQVHKESAKDYLMKHGILAKEKTAADYLAEVTSILQERYASGAKVAYYIRELVDQNPDLPIDQIGAWAKKAYGMSATNYLKNKGILSTYVYDWEAEKRKREEEQAAQEKARQERRERELNTPVEAWRYEPLSFFVEEVSVTGDEANDWVCKEKEINGSSELYLVDYQGEKSHIILPVSISGKKVAGIEPAPFLFKKCKAETVEIPGVFERIPASMFFSNDCIKHVVIGEGIKEIGNDAFFSAKNLETVKASQSIEIIHGSMAFHSTKWFDSQEDYAFVGRVLLNYSGDGAVLNVPEGIKTIAQVVTHSDVLKVVLSGTVETLCESAFNGRGSQNIKEFVYSQSLKNIGKASFGVNKWIERFEDRPIIINGILYQWNTSSASLTIPDGVSSICDSAFKDREKLKKIIFPETLTEIGDSAFSGCSGLTDVELPKGLQRIGRAAFKSCGKLRSISVGDSLVSIGQEAFNSCYEIKEISLPPTVCFIGTRAFSNCSLLSSVTLPESIQEMGDAVFCRCSWLDNVVIPNGITSIGAEFFASCSRLKNLTLPGSVKRIGSRAFENCELLESVTIPVDLSAAAFSGCKNLAEVHLAEGIKTIPQEAFKGCESLQSVEIPNSAVEIGNNAFLNCTKLQKISLSASLQKIGFNAFQNCKSLESIVIPVSVESIMDRAFMDCSSLKTVVFEGTVNHLGIDVFTNTPYLKSTFGEYAIIGGVLTKYLGSETDLTVPETVTAIAENAFAEARFIKSLHIPDSVQEIGNWLFGKPSYNDANPVALTTLELGNGVIEIGESAFQRAEKLSDIVFGRNLKKIGKQAFTDCKSLKQIDLRETSVESIGSYAFSSCYALTDLLLPGTLKVIEDSAFNSTGLRIVKLPKSTVRVGSGAFSGIKELYVYDTIEPDAAYADEWSPEQGSYNRDSRIPRAMFKQYGGDFQFERYGRQGCHITVQSAESEEIRYRIFIDSEENDTYKRLLASAWGKYASFRFSDYDDYFMKTRSLQGRAEMAFCRIQYPEGLTAEHKAIYDAYFERCMYIERSAKRIAELIAKEDNVERLEILFGYHAIDEHNLSWVKEIFTEKKATQCLNSLSKHFSK